MSCLLENEEASSTCKVSWKEEVRLRLVTRYLKRTDKIRLRKRVSILGQQFYILWLISNACGIEDWERRQGIPSGFIHRVFNHFPFQRGHNLLPLVHNMGQWLKWTRSSSFQKDRDDTFSSATKPFLFSASISIIHRSSVLNSIIVCVYVFE